MRATKLAGCSAKSSKGSDPAADKRQTREAMTVAELCDAYLADALAGRLLTRRGQAKKPARSQSTWGGSSATSVARAHGGAGG